MKTQKTIVIDVDLAQWLEETQLNLSRLINHFLQNLKGMSEEGRKTLLEEAGCGARAKP